MHKTGTNWETKDTVHCALAPLLCCTNMPWLLFIDSSKIEDEALDPDPSSTSSQLCPWALDLSFVPSLFPFKGNHSSSHLTGPWWRFKGENGSLDNGHPFSGFWPKSCCTNVHPRAWHHVATDICPCWSFVAIIRIIVSFGLGVICCLFVFILQGPSLDHTKKHISWNCPPCWVTVRSACIGRQKEGRQRFLSTSSGTFLGKVLWTRNNWAGRSYSACKF